MTSVITMIKTKHRYCLLVLPVVTLLVLLVVTVPLPGQAQPADAERRAEAEFDVGHGAEAIGLWRQALSAYRAAGDIGGQARVLDRLGTTANLTGKPAEAADYFAEVLGLARRTGNAALEADVLLKLAKAASEAGDHPRAITANRDLLARAEAAGETAIGALAAARLGQALLKAGQPQQAVSAFRRAAALFDTLGQRANEGKALDYLGDALRRQGDYVAATAAYRQAATVAHEAGNAALEASALHGLGKAYYYLGDYTGATITLQKAIRIASHAGEWSTEVATRMTLGDVQYFQGLPADAVRSYEQVLGAARASHDRELEGMALGNLGLALAHLSQYDRAAEYFRQDIAIAQERGDRLVESRALGNLGALLVEQDRYSDAIPLLVRSRALAQAIEYRRGEEIALRNLGFAQLRSGQAGAAEASLREAIAVQEALRGQTAAVDRFNISLFDTQRDAYRTLQAALVAQNRPEAALEASERGRAQALAALIVRRNTVPSPLLSIEAIRSVARRIHATLIEFSLVPADNAIYVWVVQPNGALHFRRTGLEAHGGTIDNMIEGVVRDTRATLGALGPREDMPKPTPAIAGRDDLLAMFHRILITPIVDLLPAAPEAPVVLIPEGALFLLPFAALRDARGRALIEAHTLAVAPSIQSLVLLSARRGAVAGHAIVAGNPAMSEVSLDPRGKTRVTYPPLPAAEHEAATVAALLDTRPLIGQAASKAAILTMMPDAGVIHLATHGIREDVRGQGVPGALMLAASGSDDGLLTASEIMDLRLQAGLVVLSACDTGLGNISGDGVIGLSRAFLAAGAQSVVVSLWRVPDQPTAELMQNFYRMLARAPNKASALRQAMLATRAQHPDPLAWAGFILVGESE